MVLLAASKKNLILAKVSLFQREWGRNTLLDFVCLALSRAQFLTPFSSSELMTNRSASFDMSKCSVLYLFIVFFRRRDTTSCPGTLQTRVRQSGCEHGCFCMIHLQLFGFSVCGFTFILWKFEATIASWNDLFPAYARICLCFLKAIFADEMLLVGTF